MEHVTSLLATAATEEGPPSGPVWPGIGGILIIVALALAMVFLYRSLRKQLKRIDFDPEGKSDHERMRGREVTGNGGASRRPRAADLGETPPHDAGTDGHRRP